MLYMVTWWDEIDDRCKPESSLNEEGAVLTIKVHANQWNMFYKFEVLNI